LTDTTNLESERQRAFISEVFHNLSQPLTALHCSLELALRRDETTEELRSSVAEALQCAENLRQRLLLVRALNDADDPGDLSESTDLTSLFIDLRDDFLPLFESANRKLVLTISCEGANIRGDGARLTQVMFCFLEYLFRYSREGGTVTIEICPGESHHVNINITAPSCLPSGLSAPTESSPQYSREVELAHRTFRALGGELNLVPSDGDRSAWAARLPLA
jgi:signal transduction histidine kinase